MNKTFRAATRSWKTTIAGVLAGLAIIASSLSAMWDGNPATVADKTEMMDAVFGIVVILMGFFARDADKSSKRSGVED